MAQDLSKTEMEIMRKIWQDGGEAVPSELLAFFNEKGKNWKQQTLTKMLTRMEEKGMIARKRCLVRAVVSEGEYRKQQSRRIVEEVFDGRLEQFIVAFTGNTEIPEADALILKDLVKRIGRKDGQG